MKFTIIEDGRPDVGPRSENKDLKGWTEAANMNLTFLLRDWDALSAKHKHAVLNEVIDNLASIAQLVEQAVDNR